MESQHHHAWRCWDFIPAYALQPIFLRKFSGTLKSKQPHPSPPLLPQGREHTVASVKLRAIYRSALKRRSSYRHQKTALTMIGGYRQRLPRLLQYVFKYLSACAIHATRPCRLDFAEQAHHLFAGHMPVRKGRPADFAHLSTFLYFCIAAFIDNHRINNAKTMNIKNIVPHGIR
jgi:hypothetical protein